MFLFNETSMRELLIEILKQLMVINVPDRIIDSLDSGYVLNIEI